MKKILYTLASLAVLAGCAKEAAQTEASMKTIDLTLRVDQNATKVAYDGDSHIKWLSGDALAVMIAPDKGAQSNSGAYRYSQFTVGSDLENPVFSGSMTWMDDQASEQMWVYGFYPFSAMASQTDCSIHGKKVMLPSKQTFTADSWDGAADVMAIQPVQLTGTPSGSSGDYRWQSDLTIKLAHVFGFGCLSFAGLPEDLAGEELAKVIITATNTAAATHPMAGTFTVNLESDVTLASEAPVYSASANNTVTLVAAEPAAFKDSKVWFVANPGTYDVTITAVTAGHKVTYQRSGLVIERSKIAKPTLNLKESDVVSSSAVDVTGKSWKHNATDAYTAAGNEQFFKNGTSSVDWGTGSSDRMEMNLSYVGTTGTSYYGTPQSKNNVYSQDFNYSAGRSLSGVTVTVASGSKFIGMKTIKVAAGDYKAVSYSGVASTSQIAVFVTDADGKHQIGTSQTITGSTDTREGSDFYFEAGEYTEGVLSIELSNFSNSYACPYISELEINPVPGIVIPSLTQNIQSASATSGSLACTVIGATSDPTVTPSAEWLTASYASGRISYSVAENTESENRTATITVSASNDNGSSSATVTFCQLGAKYKSYTLTIDYNAIKDALNAAAAADLEAGTIADSKTYSFDLAVSASTEAGESKEITLSFKDIRYNDSVNNEAVAVYGGYTYGRILNSTPVNDITAVTVEVASGQSAPSTKIGTTASPLSDLTLEELFGNTYAAFVGFTEGNAYFQVGASMYSYKYHYMKSVKISFLAE